MGLVLRAFIAGVLVFVALEPAAAQTTFSTKPSTLPVPAAASVEAN